MAVNGDVAERNSLFRILKPYNFAVAAAILLGIALRCYQIDYSFDGDELFSMEAANSSFAHALRVSLVDATHPPLHIFLLHAWMRLVGNSEVAVRSLSVIASAIFLWALHWLALKMSSRFSSLLVVVLCAVSPFFVFYGEQARPYALAACLAVLSTCAMVHGLEAYTFRWSLIYGMFCAALVYTQYLGVLVLLPQFGFIVLSASPVRRRLLLTGSLGILSILPWILMVGSIGHQASSLIEWFERPQVSALLRFFLALCGYLNIDGSTRILFVLYMVAIGGLFPMPRRAEPRMVVLLGVLAVFAPVAVWVVSRFGPFPIWAPRQLIGSATFFFLLVSVGIGECRRWFRLALGAALVAWCLCTVPNEFPSHSRAPWRDISSMIQAEPSDTDVVASEGYVIQPLRYYSRRDIYEWRKYAERPEKARRVVYVCRPARCKDVDELLQEYTLVEEVPIDWVRYGATPTGRLKKYVFRRNG